MSVFKLEEQSEEDFGLENHEYEDPQGCRALVAVDDCGEYVFLKKPHLWCFDHESRPQDNGFGDSFELDPGVYAITFSYRESFADEGFGRYCDDWEFTPIKIVQLSCIARRL